MNLEVMPHDLSLCAVVWFRGTDLRLHDNVIVHEAARRVEAGQVSEVRQGLQGAALVF